MEQERVELDDNLWRIALDTATAHGFDIGADCESNLRPFIQRGEEQLVKEGMSKDPEKLSIARANTLIFVTGMIAEARRKGHLELREDTFFAAKDGLCPLWPFC